MLKPTLGVVWLGPLRHAFVTAGSSVVNAAPATFGDAVGTRNSAAAAAATTVVRPASRRRPGLCFIALLPTPSGSVASEPPQTRLHHLLCWDAAARPRAALPRYGSSIRRFHPVAKTSMGRVAQKRR